MSESRPEPTAAPAAGPTAGALLRAAREKQGMHIAALAAAIKVTPKRLEALEADRYDELLDITFARALAQTVCRTLKIDAAPVLALLPQPAAPGLEQVGGSINAPFRDRPGRGDAAASPGLQRPLVWAGGALLVAALVVALLPASLYEDAPEALPPVARAASAASAPADVAAAADLAASAAAAEAAASGPLVETVFSAPPVDAGASAAVSSAPLVLRATEPSWIEVQDGRGQTLLSRIVQPGESVGLDGAMPLRLTIGNVASTQAVFRGRAVDLAAVARDNVARLELK